MAPAPKARAAGHGHITGHPDSTLVHEPEEYLIDLTEGAPVARKATNATNGDTSVAVFGTSPKTTFMRRSEDAADPGLVAVRGNINDMREHLKHLGPSNLASRPKTTRYNTVKIKTTPSRSASRQDSLTYHESPIVEVPSSDELCGGEGEGLLRSGGRDAKDGVQALQQGYGSIPRSQISPLRNESQTDGTRGLSFNVDKSRNSKSPERRLLDRHDSQDSNKSSDTLASLHSGGYSSSHRKKGVARSGSITENIIEAGGVRKVVLETNSSSEGDRDEVRDTKKSSPKFPSMLGGQSGQSESHENGDEPKSEEVKKKRRRTRKKKTAKTGGEESSAAGDPAT
jgi:metal transporter CNNM